MWFKITSTTLEQSIFIYRKSITKYINGSLHIAQRNIIEKGLVNIVKLCIQNSCNYLGFNTGKAVECRVPEESQEKIQIKHRSTKLISPRRP